MKKGLAAMQGLFLWAFCFTLPVVFCIEIWGRVKHLGEQVA
jgi:hypothetical protein